MIRIALEPDVNIEPGHQWLVLPNTPEGQVMARLLIGSAPTVRRGEHILIPHDAHVDGQIVELINALAHVRYQSPVLVQLTLKELA